MTHYAHTDSGQIICTAKTRRGVIDALLSIYEPFEGVPTIASVRKASDIGAPMYDAIGRKLTPAS